MIYHVAGVVAARSEAEFLAANRDGTRNVVEAAERAGGRPRFVLRLVDGGRRARRHGPSAHGATSRRSR